MRCSYVLLHNTYGGLLSRLQQETFAARCSKEQVLQTFSNVSWEISQHFIFSEHV